MKKALPPLFFSGTSGLQLPVPKYKFPPEFEKASRLTYYASLFNSLEVNSSFYKVPLQATVAKWAESVPEDFKFTFKLWREITHVNGFDFKKEDITRFMKTINQVGSKKGCLLIQFPPAIGDKFTKQLNKLLNDIRTMDSGDWKIVVEFRNKSWYTDSTYELLDSLKAALVIHDMPKSATPLIEQSSECIYVRFHGPTGNYSGGYSEDFLVGSSRVDLQACKLEYSIVSPK